MASATFQYEAAPDNGVRKVRHPARRLGIAFLMTALLFVCLGWLHPPLSRDISAFSLSLFPSVGKVGLVESPLREMMPSGSPSKEANLPKSRFEGPRFDSPGMLLASLIAVLMCVMLVRPGYIAIAAGLLLSGSIAANAALALNHPVLIEKLDREYEQRQQIAGALMKSPERPVLVNYRNGRIGLDGAPGGEQQRGDPIRGWVYLKYGCWLVGWSALGLLLGSGGPLNRRLGYLCGWIGLGLALACLVCFSRLQAEFFWFRAKNLEAQGRSQEARQALNDALRHFPALAQLERTWLLAGKVDNQLARQVGPHPSPPTTEFSSEERFFHAYQLSRDPAKARSVSATPDLPWLIAKGPDLSQTLGSVPSDFALMEAPETADVPEFQLGQNPLLNQRVRFLNQWQAIAVLEDLQRYQKSNDPVIRRQAARLWTDRGLHLYWRESSLTDSGPDYASQQRRLMEARSAWQRAFQWDPDRMDISVYLALVQAQSDPDHPGQADALLAPFLNGPGSLGDRVLRADLLDTLGDIYFQAGDIEEARRRYAASFDLLNLSRKHNYRAQRGLGGL
jgi:tetratricopeptide (TPR) repeat protein